MKNSELSRSHKQQEKIDNVRNISDQIQRKEASKQLRRESVTNNAQLIDYTFQALTLYPDISKKDLITKIQKMGRIMFPDKVESFVDSLIENRDLVSKMMNSSEVDVASTMYNQLLPINEQKTIPEKKGIHVIDYPLAVTLMMSPKDFHKIDPRTNIGGFHRTTQLFALRRLSGFIELLRAPLIIAKEDPRIVQHEKNHAEQGTVRKGLGKNHFTVWGSFSSNEKAIEAKDILIQKAEGVFVHSPFRRMISKTNPVFLGLLNPNYDSQPIPKEIINQSEFRELISYALAAAKEEILAEMDWQTGSGKRYLPILQTKGGTYDYFFSFLNIPKGSVLHEALWDEYKEKLEEYTKSAYELFDTYKNGDHWEGRLKIFRYILLQWPVQEWNRQLEDAGFIEEIELFEEIESTFFRSDKELKISDINTHNLSQEELSSLRLIQDIYHSIYSYVKTNCNRDMGQAGTSFIEYLKNKIGFLKYAIKKDVEKSSLTKKLKLYRAITDVYENIQGIHERFTYNQDNLGREKDEIREKLRTQVNISKNIYKDLKETLAENNEISIDRLDEDKNKLEEILENVKIILRDNKE